jgi:exoribonuclease II
LIRKGGKGAKGGEKIYIIIDGKIKYFIPIKSVKNVLEGKQEIASIRGFD